MAVATVATQLHNTPEESKQASARDTFHTTRQRSETHTTPRQSTQQEPQSLPTIHSSDSYELSLEGNAADTETITSPTTRKTRKLPSLRSPQSVVRYKSSRQARSELGRISQSPSPNFSPVDSQTSYFTLKSPGTSSLRSPTIRKPPASHSANGVETTSGPPPAISTQRAFSFELQNSVSERETPVQSKLTPDTLSRLDALNRIAQDYRQVRKTSPSQVSSGRTLREKSLDKRSDSIAETPRSATSETMDQRDKRYSLEGSRLAAHRLSAQYKNNNQALQDTTSNGSSHDDLFLNMAQIAGREDSVEQGRKPVNTLPPRRLSLAEAQTRDRSARVPEGNSDLPRNDIQYSFQTPSSDRATTRDRISPATTHPLEGRHLSRLSRGSPNTGRVDAPQDSPGFRRNVGPTSYHSRFRSAHLPATTTFNSSPITTRHQSFDRELSSSPPPAVTPRVTGTTESTVSTTAPSTVWDELDDLKLRIRKLEATGKLLPSSSGSAERPRTANTSATTMSSSSKQNGTKDVSPVATGFEDISPHPLLNSALEKARPVLNPDSYQALEAAAADALSLVKMTASSNTPTALERQLKRKADNMCRSLTELCIALLASNTLPRDRSANRARSTSRDPTIPRDLSLQQPQSASQPAEEGQFERAPTVNPEPTAGQRALSRLEARRTSIKIDAMKLAGNQLSSQTNHNLETNTPTHPIVSRTNTVLQRNQQIGDGINPEDVGFTFRSLSRAATELGRANTTGGVDRQQKRMSRDYISNHPMPGSFVRNFPGINNSGPRRNYLSSGVATTNSSTNSTVGISSGPDKDNSTNSIAPSFANRHLYTRVTDNSNNATEDAALRNSADSQAQQRLPYSGPYSTARSLLGRRAGDRRSFAGPSDETVSAGHF